MKLRFKNNPCETHLQVETGDDWCPYCLKEERDRLREALKQINELAKDIIDQGIYPLKAGTIVEITDATLKESE